MLVSNYLVEDKSIKIEDQHAKGWHPFIHSIDGKICFEILFEH